MMENEEVILLQTSGKTTVKCFLLKPVNIIKLLLLLIPVTFVLFFFFKGIASYFQLNCVDYTFNYLIPDPSVYYTTSEDFERNQEKCQIIPNNMKFDCHPETGATKTTCLNRGCCWYSIESKPKTVKNTQFSVPFCYYPKSYSIYSFTNVNNSNIGITSDLKQTSKSGFRNDISNLKVDIRYETCNRIHIKIVDAYNKRWETPIPQVMADSPGCPNKTEYNVELQKPSHLIIRRKRTQSIILDTRNAAPLIYSDQFLQFSTFLNTPFIYGLGQHLDGLLLDTYWTKRTMWNSDHHNIPGSNLYGSHPFYLGLEDSGEAHGVFLLNSNAMDVALQPSPAATFHVTGGILDFFIFTGPSPDDVVAQYKEIVGQPFLPPYWSLGYHQCRFGHKTVEDTIKVWQRTVNAGIPFDVQWNDIDYMDERNDFTYDKVNYKKLPNFVERLHKNNMKYMFIIDAALSASEPYGTYLPYEEGYRDGIFVKNLNGIPFNGKVWNRQTSVWPDFTNPKAVKFWSRWVKKLHDDIQFDGLWLDMNEPSNFWSGEKYGCPSWHLNLPPYVPPVFGRALFYRTLCLTARHYWGYHYDIHNLYGITMVSATVDALKSIKHGLRSFTISRSTFAGSGAFGGHWTGDIISDWFNLHRSVGDILTTAMMGIPMVGADICGFKENTNEQLCNRWVQLGSFYPFARNHNTQESIDQDPVAMGELVTRSAKMSLEIRYFLLPYLYTCLFKDHFFGDTAIKPLFFKYANDKTTYTIDTQFFWGNALMVVPVLHEGSTSVYGYLPEGIWYDWHSGKRLNASREFYKFEAPLDTIPLVVTGGHIIPCQQSASNTVDSRKNPFALIVALNATKEAYGEMFWDDGITAKTVSYKNYIEFTFRASSTNLNISYSLHNWRPKDQMSLGWVDVFGVDVHPHATSVNGILADYHYDRGLRTLHILTRNVSLMQDISIEW